jgi:hypothetical protein
MTGYDGSGHKSDHMMKIVELAEVADHSPGIVAFLVMSQYTEARTLTPNTIFIVNKRQDIIYLVPW